MRLIESRRKSPVVTDDFLTTFLADQERVSGESRRKNRGGIKVPTQGLFYIIFSLIYIPPIFFNKKYIRKHRSGAAEKSSKMVPTTFDDFRGDRHQINEISRQCFRRLSEVAVAA